MKKIVISYYLLFLGATGNRSVAYYAAVVVVSILSVVTLGGLFSLLNGMVSTESLSQLFTWPRCFIPGSILLLVFIAVTPPSRLPSKDTVRRPSVSIIAITLIIALFLFPYSVLSELLLN